MVPLPVYFYFIGLSFLVSLTVYGNPRPGNNYLRLWPPYLLATMIVEYIGSYLYQSDQNNVWLYNFFVIIEFGFYLINLSFFIRSARIKKIIRYTILPYALIATINILFIQGPMTFNTTTYSIGCLLIVSFCIYYFFELFRSPKAVKLRDDPAFWICTGLLFFYCCSFPLYAFINFWMGISRLLIKSFDSIVIILNAFLYTLFTIAFICNRTRNYTLSSS